MSLNRFKIGTIITIAWILVMIGFIVFDFSHINTMKPNEWGDFFAGFFAPLAFLWLVLGYLQQGEELQLSTRALQLQAEELKNSVEQQRELVDVTRQQLDGEREALQLERLARKDAAKPLFVIKNQSGSFSDDSYGFGISVINAGNTVTQVVGVISGQEISSFTFFETALVVRSGGFSKELTLTTPFPDTDTTLTVSYIDAFGQSGQCLFSVVKQSADSHSLLTFIPIEA